MLLIECKIMGREETFPQSDLFKDWYDLVTEAKRLGLTIEEVRAFLISGGRHPEETDVL